MKQSYEKLRHILAERTVAPEWTKGYYVWYVLQGFFSSMLERWDNVLRMHVKSVL